MRFSARARHRVTVVVWLLGMMAAATLIARRPAAQIRGLAFSEPIVLAAPADGVLPSDFVELHEVVEEARVIVSFDASLLEARRDVLLAEIEAAARDQSANASGRARVFARDREEASLELGQLRSRVLEGQARVDALQEELEVEERLFEQGVAPREKVQEVRREIQVVETRLRADRERLGTAQRSSQQATSREAVAVGGNEWEVETLRRELAELDEEIAQLVVTSPITGQVTEVHSRRGEWVAEGERLVRISPMQASEVHAWVESRSVAWLEVGAGARVRGASGVESVGRVVSVGVERLRLPRSLWARTDAPEWGYLVRVALDGEGLAPGEPVQVALL